MPQPRPGLVLDPQLEADTILIGDLGLSRVLLMNDARYPWLILVPRRPRIEELVDLDKADQHRLMDEIAAASLALSTLYAPDKLNVGALGNRVRQLHVHVLARYASDPAWPGPVWGHSPAVPYAPHQQGIAASRIAKALGIDGD